jgi:thiamine biosynthesis protein ThiS
MLKINGKDMNYAGKSLLEYLEEADYNLKAVVVERNGEILTREQFDGVVLCDEDVIEVVSFMGGGAL